MSVVLLERYRTGLHSPIKSLLYCLSISRLVSVTSVLSPPPALQGRINDLKLRFVGFHSNSLLEKSHKMNETEYKEIVQELKAEKVKAVVFDFDCTISIKHSGGRVRKDKFTQFLENNISPCFRYILPRLLGDGFQVGVATFADSFHAPATHIAGEELVRAFFRHYFQDDFADRIPIIADYPGPARPI